MSTSTPKPQKAYTLKIKPHSAQIHENLPLKFHWFNLTHSLEEDNTLLKAYSFLDVGPVD